MHGGIAVTGRVEGPGAGLSSSSVSVGAANSASLIVSKSSLPNTACRPTAAQPFSAAHLFLCRSLRRRRKCSSWRFLRSAFSLAEIPLSMFILPDSTSARHHAIRSSISCTASCRSRPLSRLTLPSMHWLDPSIHQSINQSVNQSINQSVIYLVTKSRINRRSLINLGSKLQV